MLEGIEDLSWRNDTCPSFGQVMMDGELYVRCFVEHPDPLLRECGSAARFSLRLTAASPAAAELAEAIFPEWDLEPLSETDDPKVAARSLVECVLAVRAAASR